MENKEENTLTSYEIYRDRYGKKHRIYSARFKDLQTITDFTTKYDPTKFGMYAMSPVLDEEGEIEYLPDGRINFNNGFIDDLFEIIELALDHRENREQIEEWLDFENAKTIVGMLLNLSSFKKKVM